MVVVQVEHTSVAIVAKQGLIVVEHDVSRVLVHLSSQDRLIVLAAANVCIGNDANQIIGPAGHQPGIPIYVFAAVTFRAIVLCQSPYSTCNRSGRKSTLVATGSRRPKIWRPLRGVGQGAHAALGFGRNDNRLSISNEITEGLNEGMDGGGRRITPAVMWLNMVIQQNVTAVADRGNGRFGRLPQGRQHRWVVCYQSRQRFARCRPLEWLARPGMCMSWNLDTGRLFLGQTTSK
jgi:hypothetical protein